MANLPFKRFLNFPNCQILILILTGPLLCVASAKTPEAVGVQYDRQLALYLVEYASAVYTDEAPDLWAWNCTRCRGLTAGFHMVDVIIDTPKILQAYVGVSETLNAVVVAFRGTRQRSILNWMADLYFLELNLSYPGVDNALVHWGFYSSYHNTSIRDRVIAAVDSVRSKNPDLGVYVTGHSLGASLACLCALDLTVNLNIPDVYLMTFGQPRIGNKAFAAFFNEKVPRSIRMTHNHDPVPHLPPSGTAGGIYDYYHTATEVWIYYVGPSKMRRYEIEKVCDSSGEDPTCSRSVMGNSILDHLQYLGVPLCINFDEIIDEVKQSNASTIVKR